MRYIKWIVTGLALLLVSSCVITGYDYLHDSTYTLHYDGFTVDVSEDGKYMDLSAFKAQHASNRSPFFVRIEEDGPEFPLFDLPEDYLTQVWKWKRRFDNRPPPKTPGIQAVQNGEEIIYPLSSDKSGHGKQSYYRRYYESIYDSFDYEDGQLADVTLHGIAIRLPKESKKSSWKLYGTRADVERRLGKPNRVTREHKRLRILPTRWN